MAKNKKTAKAKKTILGQWTKREIELLRKEFPRKTCEDVSQMLKRPFYAVKRKAYRMGIYKSKSYLKSIGRS